MFAHSLSHSAVWQVTARFQDQLAVGQIGLLILLCYRLQLVCSHIDKKPNSDRMLLSYFMCFFSLLLIENFSSPIRAWICTFTGILEKVQEVLRLKIRKCVLCCSCTLLPHPSLSNHHYVLQTNTQYVYIFSYWCNVM